MPVQGAREGVEEYYDQGWVTVMVKEHNSLYVTLLGEREHEGWEKVCV